MSEPVAAGRPGLRVAPTSSPTPGAEGAVLSADDVLAIVEHELANLITVLSALADRLDRRWDQLSDGERRSLAGRLAAQCRASVVLLRNLRALGGPEPFAPTRHPLPVVDAAEVLTSLTQDLRAAVPDHPLLLEVRTPLPPMALDVPRLQQVLLNVVGNAARYAPPGSPVILRASTDGPSSLVLEVDDCGPGVPGPSREQVFGKFVRSGHPAAGHGLGLFVSRGLVKAQGGTISVADAPSGGCRVRIEWPVDPDDPTRGGEPVARGRGPAQPR